MIAAVVAGFLTGISLIVAIGAQNAYVLRQGLTGRFVFAVAAVSAVLDATLIVVGVAGLGAFLNSVPWLLELVRWLGAAYLVWFGIASLRRARSAGGLTAAANGSTSLGAALIASLTFSLLNPHVYLDTVVFLGAVANQFGDGRWWFAVGAATASFVWFFGLAYGARALSPHIAKPAFWRVLDSIIAVIMFGLAASLLMMPLG